MGRTFNIPVFYRSPIITRVKSLRKIYDHRKKDLSPSILDLGPVRFKIARHFGFCFGVENAIEIAFRALSENPNRRVFLLSEMIHNPQVNQDLQSRGVRFLLSTTGETITPFEELTPQDVVIVPAFGTTVELFERLKSLGIDPTVYDATCPFVEKVWKRAEQLGKRGYAVIIHGKHYHEETKATASHASLSAPTLVIRDRAEAEFVADTILGKRTHQEFWEKFSGRCSEGFCIERDLSRFGVVNQTTMLAHETHAISELLKKAMVERYGEAEAAERVGDTRDTLCYATSENQEATHALISSGGDLAIVVGGYNSSNTANLAELLEKYFSTFYVKDAAEILNSSEIRHLNRSEKKAVESKDWLPQKAEASPVDILITAGASCPDALVDEVMEKVRGFFKEPLSLEEACNRLEKSLREGAVE